MSHLCAILLPPSAPDLRPVPKWNIPHLHEVMLFGDIITTLFLLNFLGQNHAYLDMKVTWIKRVGFWGFMFFLVKGLLWLIVPGLIALWAAN